MVSEVSVDWQIKSKMCLRNEKREQKTDLTVHSLWRRRPRTRSLSWFCFWNSVIHYVGASFTTYLVWFFFLCFVLLLVKTSLAPHRTNCSEEIVFPSSVNLHIKLNNFACVDLGKTLTKAIDLMWPVPL